ncbi:benzoate-CoA ligase family protein [Actinacidiphila oryziradicis]|uniref:Benzoate-CoA ligase family protein n=1 Tax=Actinacidiphila oryziradicis TaxID=2571141 RepID=A0A4U0S9T3_9ACTN|nr:benzoate-CoA ligase family protein [Actinacidiphila oryziradicis]TKA04977.1 benzoate-CoA ligase family protein [Actinacidiphila oryziradicis]
MPAHQSRTLNAQTWLVDRQVDNGRGEHIAVRGAGGTLTYRELADVSADAAAGLRSLGLRPDDRVLFVMNDDVPMLAGILGAFRAGFVAVPLSTMLNGRELDGLVADSGASVLVASQEYAEAALAAAEAAPQLRYLVVDAEQPLVTPAGIQALTWAELIKTGAGAAADQRAAAPTTEDTWALWLYTSGTTGFPKAAIHRHANIRHVSETYGARVLGITPDDSCLSVAKLFFAYGLGNGLFFPLSVGATTVLESRRPTPEVFGERVRQDRPTLFFGVPTFYAALLASDLPDDTFASVRLATSAGEPLPAGLQEGFGERFGVEIIDGIGSTEALHIFLSNRPGEVRAGTTGRPVPGYDIELRDATGLPVPDHTPASLYVRGQSIAEGYWRRTDASRTVFQGQWLNTGDVYVRSQDGYYTCLGRSDDMLKAGGIWISPAEIESRLLEHPAVAETAVVALTDASGLDKPVACVVTAAPVTSDELIQWCRNGLASFKRPRAVIFMEELPKTSTGKLQRIKIRQLVANLNVHLSAAFSPIPTSASGGHT